ncbi:site-2 protease family protein [Myxococcota bacterium]|nr:site-2 protease family protein [Myxococcota bacterium]
MLVLSVTVHEYAHALAASKLGDDLPERQGRLTLNPAAHADPIGTLLLPLISAVTSVPLFGWGRPVETIPTAYTRKFSMRAGSAIVAFAGPASNLVIAILCSGVFVGLLVSGAVDHGSAAVRFFQGMIFLNLTLFFLNMIPMPPFDGSKVAAWMFGYKADRVLDQLAGLGPVFLILVIMFGGTYIARASYAVADLLLASFVQLLT